MPSSVTPVHFFYMIQLYCERLRAKMGDYWRPPEREAIQEKPVAHSPHEVWLGLDVTYPEPRPVAERVEWGRRLGLLVIVEGDHDHLQPLDWEAG